MPDGWTAAAVKAHPIPSQSLVHQQLDIGKHFAAEYLCRGCHKTASISRALT